MQAVHVSSARQKVGARIKPLRAHVPRSVLRLVGRS